jgi:hypothetical protein
MSLEQNKFDVVVSQSFNDEITGQLDAMLEKDVRIILGNFNESWARYILSIISLIFVSRKDVSYPETLYILHNTQSLFLPISNQKLLQCNLV